MTSTILSVRTLPTGRSGLDLLDGPAWMTDPACGCAPGKADPDLFFSHLTGERRMAQRICAGCPFTTECDQYATELDIRHGVWGGVLRDDATRSSKWRRRKRIEVCAHIWPDELEPETPCTGCGLEYGEWSEEDDEQ